MSLRKFHKFSQNLLASAKTQNIGATLRLVVVLNLLGCGTEGGNPHKQEEKRDDKTLGNTEPAPEVAKKDVVSNESSDAPTSAGIEALPPCKFSLMFSEKSSKSALKNEFSFEFISTESNLIAELFSARVAKKETPNEFLSAGATPASAGEWILIVDQALPPAEGAAGDEGEKQVQVVGYCQSEFKIEPTFDNTQSVKILVTGKVSTPGPEDSNLHPMKP